MVTLPGQHGTSGQRHRPRRRLGQHGLRQRPTGGLKLVRKVGQRIRRRGSDHLGDHWAGDLDHRRAAGALHAPAGVAFRHGHVLPAALALNNEAHVRLPPVVRGFIFTQRKALLRSESNLPPMGVLIKGVREVVETVTTEEAYHSTGGILFGHIQVLAAVRAHFHLAPSIRGKLNRLAALFALETNPLGRDIRRLVGGRCQLAACPGVCHDFKGSLGVSPGDLHLNPAQRIGQQDVEPADDVVIRQERGECPPG